MAEKLTAPKPLTLYGDYFDADTRTVLTLLALGNVKHKFVEVDQFRGQQNEAKFRELNPCGGLPILEDNHFLVIGQTRLFVNYLSNSKARIRSYLPTEHAPKIDQFLNWHESVLKPCVRRYVRVIIEPKIYGKAPLAAD